MLFEGIKIIHILGLSSSFIKRVSWKRIILFHASCKSVGVIKIT